VIFSCLMQSFFILPNAKVRHFFGITKKYLTFLLV